jgi:hypothetical protein
MHLIAMSTAYRTLPLKTIAKSRGKRMLTTAGNESLKLKLMAWLRLRHCQAVVPTCRQQPLAVLLGQTAVQTVAAGCQRRCRYHWCPLCLHLCTLSGPSMPTWPPPAATG